MRIIDLLLALGGEGENACDFLSTGMTVQSFQPGFEPGRAGSGDVTGELTLLRRIFSILACVLRVGDCTLSLDTLKGPSSFYIKHKFNKFYFFNQFSF